jgi:hypothetical protein
MAHRPSHRRQVLGVRSNLNLSADLEARIRRIADAHARYFGVAGAGAGASHGRLADTRRLLIEIGAAEMERKLGLAPKRRTPTR